MVTSRGIVLLAGAALAWLAGRTLGIGELYAVAVAAAAVVALGLVYVRTATGSVAVRRSVDRQRVVAGALIDADLELRNDARLPSPTLLVADALPEGVGARWHPVPGEARFVLGGLGPGRIAVARYTAVAGLRGRYDLGPARVTVRDPFGVAERTRRYGATNELLVYPHVEELPATPVRGAHMGSGSSDTRRVLASGEDFYTMREYVRGDDLRHVHWPSTAHRQTLMVRQMEQPWQAHATVYLDTRRSVHTGGPAGTLEKAVSVAATLVHQLAGDGYRLRLVTDTIAGRTAPETWEAAMDHLAVLEASGSTGLTPSIAATRSGEGLFVGVLGVPGAGAGRRTDLARHPDLRALYGVRGFGQRVALVVGEDDDADRVAGLLRAAGWQAAALTPSTPLRDVWTDLVRGRARHGSPTP